MRKSFSLIILFVFLSLPLFALSFTYMDTPQSYDSDILLSSFEKNKDFLMSDENNVEDILLAFYGPGGQVYEYYGHVGIIVRYKNGREVLYDYGVFNASEKGFLKNVIQGKMFYSLAYGERKTFMENYMRSVSRSVKYYRLLELSDEKKSEIESFLRFNSRDDRDKYLYNFFNDNCSTRVRDILDIAYNGALREYGKRSFGTRRTAIETQTSPHVATETVFGIAEGDLQDKEINYYDAMFLPSILEYSLRNITINKEDGEAHHIVALEGESVWKNIYEYNAIEKHTPSKYTILLLVILQIVLLNIVFKLLYKTKVSRFATKLFCLLNACVFLFLFILSLAMSIMCLYTIFDCAWENQNLIFINPLLILGVIYSLKGLLSSSFLKEEKALYHLSIVSLFYVILCVIALILKFTVLPYQANLVHILYFALYYLSIPDYDKLYKRIKNKKNDNK